MEAKCRKCGKLSNGQRWCDECFDREFSRRAAKLPGMIRPEKLADIFNQQVEIKRGCMSFIQTIVVSKRLDVPRITACHIRELGWKCIFDSVRDSKIDIGNYQFWINENDLKEEFTENAKKVFGDNLLQIIRLHRLPDADFSKIMSFNLD